jgi:hypothetical protein
LLELFVVALLVLRIFVSVLDFWKEIGEMSKTDALAQLEKFFYQGLEHKGVQLPAAINFAHYTHGTEITLEFSPQILECV